MGRRSSDNPITVDWTAISEKKDNQEYRNLSYKRDNESRRKGITMDKRQFLCWDGEGAGIDDNGAQNYVLFGNSSGERIISERLNTIDMLRFIIEQGRKYYDRINVGFAFEYDVNMILSDLSINQFRSLRKNGTINYGGYRISHIPHKWIEVTELHVNKKDNFTVRISDVFGFFQTSFLKAIKQYIPESPLMEQLDIVEKGKADRNIFSYKEIEYIERYWSVEIALFEELANKLRSYLYEAGFRISSWHGSGAIASYIYKTNGIKQHKSETYPEIYDAARYGYAGGRFELFNMGRHLDVYSYDINSAYPTAISKLPSLSEGNWNYIENPKAVKEFGIYHIKINRIDFLTPAPVFHRDKNANIAYSWDNDVWVWSPEAAQVLNIPGVTFLEAWEYTDYSTYPFSGFVPEYYSIRKEAKSRGQGVQMAYKLGLNSLYGKMAQRVGGYKGAPIWHQLEWAGWVTSYTRAMLYNVMKNIPYGKLIAVETDGLYTTATPEELNIEDSKELGGWEISHYDEMLYLQSGMYSYRNGNTWGMKYRGLDKNSLSPELMAETLKKASNSEWPTLKGPTTRFVGYRAALQSVDNFYELHRHWITSDKEISFGDHGKRIHISKICPACKMGLNAYEMPHTLFIVPIADSHSYRHDIPWINDNDLEAQWRIDKMIQDEVFF